MTTALTYRGERVTLRRSAEGSVFGCVVEGSVQHDQNRVRVDAQLVERGVQRPSLGGALRGEPWPTSSSLQDQVVARLGDAAWL